LKQKSKKQSLNNGPNNNHKNGKQPVLVCVLTAVIGVTAILGLVFSDKFEDPDYKTQYQTSESDVSMPTAKAGETEVSTDAYGNEFVVNQDGLYKRSDVGAGFEKVSQQKVVPLVGTWVSDDTGIVYKFGNDETFSIYVPYENDAGKYDFMEYSGKVNVREKYTDSFLKFKFNDMNALFKYMGIDGNSFVKENLYYIELKYDKIVNSATGQEIPFDASNSSEEEADGATFDGLMYTFWVQDSNSYKMKVASATGDNVQTFVRK
jgi:hypothetical protein